MIVYDGEVAVSPHTGGMGWDGRAPQPGVQKPQQAVPPQEVGGPTEVSVEAWMQIVKAQQQLYVQPDGTYKVSDYNAEEDAKLDWVQWNRRRDRLIQR